MLRRSRLVYLAPLSPVSALMTAKVGSRAMPTEWTMPLSQSTPVGKSAKGPKVFSPIMASLTKSLRNLREYTRDGPARETKGWLETAEAESLPSTTQYLITSAVISPLAFSKAMTAVSVGAKTVKGPSPLSVSATPVEARRAAKSPNPSDPRKSLSSFPTAIPSAPQTCPGPSRAAIVSTMLASRLVVTLPKVAGAKAAAEVALRAMSAAVNCILEILKIV
mmetsp:Transcript_17279/g.31204  ORF Transcript_17279/g.31204 Transcript_17279/m.31204 type:complete len:221 (-) Transcript_17279:11-673(-)